MASGLQSHHLRGKVFHQSCPKHALHRSEAIRPDKDADRKAAEREAELRMNDVKARPFQEAVVAVEVAPMLEASNVDGLAKAPSPPKKVIDLDH